jgi:hypothetical protein
MTHAEIERVLVARVEKLRAEYERLEAASQHYTEAASGIMGTADETLSIGRAMESLNDAIEARQRFNVALKELNDFIFRGKLPVDFKLTDEP